jgi:hypothetical protein
MQSKTCPECHSTRIDNNQNYGYYKCLDCAYVWGYPEDDPDYDEQIIGDQLTTETLLIDGQWTVIPSEFPKMSVEDWLL